MEMKNPCIATRKILYGDEIDTLINNENRTAHLEYELAKNDAIIE